MAEQKTLLSNIEPAKKKPKASQDNSNAGVDSGEALTTKPLLRPVELTEEQLAASGDDSTTAVVSEPVAAASGASGLQRMSYYGAVGEVIILGFLGIAVLQQSLKRSGPHKTLAMVVGTVTLLAALQGFVGCHLYAGYLQGGSGAAALILEVLCWIYVVPVMVWFTNQLEKKMQSACLGVTVTGVSIAVLAAIGGLAGLGVGLAFFIAMGTKFVVLAVAALILVGVIPGLPALEAASDSEVAPRKKRSTASGLPKSLVAEASARVSDPPFDPFGEPVQPAANPSSNGNSQPAKREVPRPAPRKVPVPMTASKPKPAPQRSAPQRAGVDSGGNKESNTRPSIPNVRVKAPPKPKKRI